MATARSWASDYATYFSSGQYARDLNKRGEYTELGIAREAWLEHRKLHKAESTVSGGRTATLHLVETFGEESHPAGITSKDLQGLIDSFLEHEYMPGTLAGYRNQWVAFFAFTKVEPNPAIATTVPETDREDTVAWTEEEQDEIRNAASTLDASEPLSFSRRRLVEFLFGVGPRIQEAAAAEWEWINQKSRTARIKRQVSRRTSEMKKTKGGEPRTAVVLPSWWEYHDEKANGLIFPDPDGTPVRYRKMYDHIREILELAQLKKRGQASHQFWHTYAWLMLEMGATMEHLQKSLGHGSIKTTQAYYDHWTSEHAARSGVGRIYNGRRSSRRGPRRR